MPELATPLPCRRAELVIRPLGERGPYVVKDPGSGAYYHLGDEEHFLLTQLDGRHDADEVRAAFGQRFGQTLGDEELHEFLEMAAGQGLLEPASGGREPPEPGKPQGADGPRSKLHARRSAQGADAPRSPAPLGLRVLYWRKSLFDPDRLFTWLAPKLWFCWTPAFLLFSASCIVWAALLLWANRQGLAGSFLSALRWQTALLAWLALMAVTTCHEFAHGLTCKHHGGEVHEVGFLMLFLMPCFYCNVSDAWLFREKSKRLWVTLAGGYFELFLWALAVFIWRLTTPDNLVNYLAFIVLSACGVQTLFNFNPLLKLDGYYLLSDWMEVPNLQQRAADYVKGHLRRLLWGAPPAKEEWPGGGGRRTRRALLLYGLVSWLYSLAFLGVSLVVMSHFLGARLGLLGLAAAGLLALLSLRGLFHGCMAGEVRNMILYRHKRTAVWLLVLGGVAAGLWLIEMEDRAGGTFRLRPATRAELRAPVAGFVREVYLAEGERASPGGLVARLEVPDLESRLTQKGAEVREARAKLRLLEQGPRPEEVAEQRRRVERARDWRDLARGDLAHQREALAADLARLDQQVAQYQAELDIARDAHSRVKNLRVGKAAGSVSEQEYREKEAQYRASRHRLEQARAEKRARQARGTLEAEAELAKRAKELADARAALALLELGNRAEEIEAERARLARLHEEVRYLEDLRGRVQVVSPVGGLIVTPHLREKVGQYLHEGELIGVVEEPAGLEAEIALAEQDVLRVQPGQRVELKARALPFETRTAQVDRIAPAAERGDAQSTVTVYCRLPSSLAPGGRGVGPLSPLFPRAKGVGGDGEAEPGLRSEMTGYARIYTGRRRAGEIVVDRVLRFIRTEFWW